MNNDINIDNIDNIYRLYKLIFNNKWLCCLIFNNIRKLNNQKRKSGIIKKSMKYDEPDFNWMTVYCHFELLIDRIKFGKKPVHLSIDTKYIHLELFLKYIETTKVYQNQFEKDQIKLFLGKFYNTNLSRINEIYSVNSNESEVYLGDIVLSNFLMLFQIVYEYYNKPKQNYKLLDLALRSGNLEFVKYLHEQLGIEFNNSTTLYNSLLSDNRNSIVEYLLQIKPNPPIQNEYSNYNKENIGYHFKGLLKLNNNLFSKLVIDLNVPFQFDYLNKENEIHSIFYTFYKYECNANGDIFEIQPIFQSLINSFYILSNSKSLKSKFKIQFNSSLLLNKINHLLKYNENQDDKMEIENYNSSLKQFKFQQLTKYSQCFNENNNDSTSLISSFLKLFSKESSSSTTPSTVSSDIPNSIKSNLLDTNCSEIDYSNFNLSKEIERIIIFDYLNLISQYGYSGFKSLMNMIFNFANKYNEYDKIALIKEIGLKHCRDSSNITFCEYLVNMAIKLSDIKLIQLLPTLIGDDGDKKQLELVLKEQRSARLEITDKIDTINSIDNQIKFIITSFKLFIFSNIQKETKILSRLFFNNQFNSINQFIEIAEFALKPYTDNHKINCEWLTKNRIAFIYYHQNYKSLFYGWENQKIAKTIIEIGDLQLIQYAHDNELCGFFNVQQLSSNIDYFEKFGNLIKYSLNRQVAEFLFKLGYNRISKNVFGFSFFSEFQSNYLFRWAVKRLIQSPLFESLELHNLNVYQKKFIDSLVTNGELDINKLQITDDKVKK